MRIAGRTAACHVGIGPINILSENLNVCFFVSCCGVIFLQLEACEFLGIIIILIVKLLYTVSQKKPDPYYVLK